MTAIRHSRGLRSACESDHHNWLTQRYAARDGAHEMRVCDACGRAEMALPTQRSGRHLPAHSVQTAAAA